jgi:hypothetical protein
MTTKTETQFPTFFHVLEAARAELKTFVERGIDLAEQRSKAAFRFARNLTKRLGGKRPPAKAKRRAKAPASE